MPSLLKPLQFRFTDPDDIAQYGDRYWIYDESAIIGSRARTLMALEQEIGAPMADIMAGVRASSAFGDMAGSWVAMKLDPESADKVPAFEDYNPIVMMIKWSPVPDAELEPGKEEAPSGDQPPLEPGGSPDHPDSAPVTLPAASGTGATSPMDTVSLLTMPVSGSATS